jgi:ABC-type lipoprotein release transport system permease subunit
VFGIALVVTILNAVLSLASGLESTLATAASPRNVIVLRRGSTSAEASALVPETVAKVRASAAVALSPSGEPLATEAFITSVLVPVRGGGSAERLVMARGVDALSAAVHEGVRFDVGGPPRRNGGIAIGRAVAAELGGITVGSRLPFGRRDWEVVGIFSAGGSALESEVWTDLRDLMTDMKRDPVSIVTFRVSEPARVAEIAREMNDDPNLGVKALTEARYYEEQGRTGAQTYRSGMVVALLMAVGALFAGMNTMYTAVAGRVREIATLRALGFSRRSVLESFVVESLSIGALGGILGALMSLSLFAFVWRSITILGGGLRQIVVTFEPTAAILGIGVLFAMAIGALGGYFPARSAARLEVVHALRRT